MASKIVAKLVKLSPTGNLKPLVTGLLKGPVTTASKGPVIAPWAKAPTASAKKPKARRVPKTNASGKPTGRGTGQQHQQRGTCQAVPGAGNPHLPHNKASNTWNRHCSQMDMMSQTVVPQRCPSRCVKLESRLSTLSFLKSPTIIPRQRITSSSRSTFYLGQMAFIQEVIKEYISTWTWTKTLMRKAPRGVAVSSLAHYTSSQ